MRIHLAAAFYVVVCGFAVRLLPCEWAAVLLCIALVIGAECFNTAIEALCDKLHPAHAQEIEKVKDASAGGVLVCAFISVFVGASVFFRAEKVRALFSFLFANPVVFVLLVLTVPAWIYFIALRRKKNDR